MALVLFLAAALLLLARQLTRRQKKLDFIRSNGCQPARSSYPHLPCCFGIEFLIENALNILRHRFAYGVRERFDKYGKTHIAYLMNKLIINTIEPDNLAAVMTTNFDDYTIFPGRKKLMITLMGEGIFATTGPDWLHSRMLVRSAMAGLRYDSEVFERHAARLVEWIVSSRQEGFGFNDLAFRYTMDVSTEVFFGHSIGSNSEGMITNKEKVEFRRDFTALGRMARVLTIFISQIPCLANAVFWDDYVPTGRRVHQFIDRRIEEAARSNQESDLQSLPSREGKNVFGGRKTLLEGLTRQSTDFDRIRHEALNLLLAGHDTVGNCVG